MGMGNMEWRRLSHLPKAPGGRKKSRPCKFQMKVFLMGLLSVLVGIPKIPQCLGYRVKPV